MDGQYEEYPEAIDYHDDRVSEYEDTNYSQNWINTRNPTEMSILQRRMVAGQPMKLPDEPTVTDAFWESFKGTFLSDLSDDVTEKVKTFRFLWEDEDENASASKPSYGVAKDMIQLGKLMKSNKILRTDIEYRGQGHDDGHPSSHAWTAIGNLTSLQITKVEASEGVEAVEPTVEFHRKIIDNIVNFITGKYYYDKASTEHPNALNTGPEPGTVAQLYFKDYSDNIKIMRKAYKAGQVMLTSDLSPNYCAGFYPDYQATMNAIKRRFGRDQTQDTMIDFFKKLDKAMADKSPHEFKIGLLRGILKKQYVIDPDEFFVCKDFLEDRNLQRHPEEYSPIINTLLQYIIFSRSIDKSRWDAIEKEYHNIIPGKPTYKSWHENRQELYKILDEETKKKRLTVNQIDATVYNIEADDAIDDMTDTELVAWVRQKRATYKRGGGGRGQNRPKMPPGRRFDPNFRRSAQAPIRKPFPSPNIGTKPNYRKMSMEDKRNGLRRLLCRNCSRWAGENRYHQGPYGGTSESKCPYDDKGRPRPGYRFIRAYFGTDVNEIGVEDINAIDDEGCDYEEPSNINTINYNPYEVDRDSYDMTHMHQSIGSIE